MEDLAQRGFTGVLHAFSENDLNYYRDQMRRIVEVSLLPLTEALTSDGNPAKGA